MEMMETSKNEDENPNQTKMLMNSLLFVALLIFIQLVTSDPEYQAYKSESYSYAYAKVPAPSVVEEFIQFTKLAEQELRK